MLRQLRSEGMSILMVEHDMDNLVMDVTDHIVVMEFGNYPHVGARPPKSKPRTGARAYLGTGTLKGPHDVTTTHCLKSWALKAGYGWAEVLQLA